ncbi:ABC transporter permease [Aliagarivorans taiwanensis]|uniref:ABC transporter permease n=1 Tax=Aliagarivorans taiwanensis TaxID=561966 RepID=UPI00041F9F26|nr:FtsX-like permease family protein [Aliagarivorans taiwanensis]
MRRLTQAWLNVQRNRRRSLMSVSIIAIAVFALLSAGGFGLYTYQSLAEASARESGHISVTMPGYFDSEEDYPLQNGIADSNVLIKSLLSHQQVKAVQPRVEFSGLASNGEKSAIFIGQGVQPNEFRQKGPFLDIVEGKLLDSYNPDEAPQVVLGKDLARNLKMQIGDWLTLLSTTSEGALNAYDFVVSGIVSTGVPEMDKRLLYIDLNAAQALLDSQRVSVVSMYFYDYQDVGPMLQTLSAPSAQQTPSLEFTPWWERAVFYDAVRNLYNRIFGVMGAVMALVVFVALFNTLSMSVTERTREIGTLAAMGTSPAEQLRGFVYEALVMALIGCVLGIIANGALSAGLLVADIQMPPPPGRTDGYPLQVYFSPILALWVTVSIAVICAGASAIAALKGVRKPITEALIYV